MDEYFGFNVGDIVRIKKWEDLERDCGLTAFGDIAGYDIVLDKSMKDLCGLKAVIQEMCYHERSMPWVSVSLKFIEDRHNPVDIVVSADILEHI